LHLFIFLFAVFLANVFNALNTFAKNCKKKNEKVQECVKTVRCERFVELQSFKHTVKEQLE